MLENNLYPENSGAHLEDWDAQQEWANAQMNEHHPQANQYVPMYRQAGLMTYDFIKDFINKWNCPDLWAVPLSFDIFNIRFEDQTALREVLNKHLDDEIKHSLLYRHDEQNDDEDWQPEVTEPTEEESLIAFAAEDETHRTRQGTIYSKW